VGETRVWVAVARKTRKGEARVREAEVKEARAKEARVSIE
jgi:hypothetical protein